MLRFAVFLFIFCLTAYGGLSDAHAEKRVALVIGNSAYEHAPALNNPKNDATAMSEVLQKLGFEVVTGIDLSHVSFAKTVNQFRKKLQGADVGLFFYAGHGLQVHGRNYLAPIDAELENETSLNFQAIQLHVVLQLMERSAKTNLVFLDACRDNPLASNLARSMGTRSTAIGRGLAREETGLGTMISFATQPGNVALDGQGNNSPFAEAMLKHIEAPGMDVALVMRRVREDVIKATSGSQVPWSNSSLTGSFVFKDRPKEKPKVVKTPAVDPLAIELAFWQAAKDEGTRQALEAYLTKYPKGNFAPLASIKLGAIAKPERAAAKAEKQSQQKLVALQPPEQQVRQSDTQTTPVLNERTMALALQNELKRVGCDPGRVDGKWGRLGTRALTNFNKYAKVNLPTDTPSVEAVEAVKGVTERVCPLTCSPQFNRIGDQCVKKTCRSGQRLNSRGKCIKVVVKKVVKQPVVKAAPKKKKAADSGDDCRKRWAGYSTMSAYCP